MAHQRTERAVLHGGRLFRIEDLFLQHRRRDDQAVLRQVVGQRGLLRQHVPATVGVALADALHLLAMAPGGGDQHVAAEAAAAHRLHAVVEVAAGRADFDLQLVQLGLGFALGGIAEPGAALDAAAEGVAYLAGDLLGTALVVARHIPCGVFLAQHRTRGQVDGVQHLAPARRRRGFAAQHAAAELELGVAERLGQVRRHGIAHAPAQIGLPLVGLQAAHQAVQALEQRRVGQGNGVVADALRLQERVQLQVAVLLAQVLGRHRRVVRERAAQFDDGLGDLRQLGLQVDHQRRFGIQPVGRGAGQRQYLLDVAAIAAQQFAGVGIGTGVVGRVGQAQATLHEVADVAVQRLQVHVGAEVEGHRDAHLVQRGDGRRDVLGLLDGVDAVQQRRDRPGTVGLDGGFVQAAGPEVAQQLLHVALRRAHRVVEQRALLFQRALAEGAQHADRTGIRRHAVLLQPVRIGRRVEVGALRADGGGTRRALLALRFRIRGAQGDDEGEGDQGGAAECGAREGHQGLP